MPQYDAGTAGIKIKPSFRDFVRETETELKRYDFSMDVRVGADTATARAEIEQLQRIARENQTFRMSADTRVAAAEVENLQRIARENQTFRMDANTATAAAEIEALKRAMRDGWTVTPSVNGARARGGMSSLTSDLRRMGTLNITVAGVVGAPGVLAQLLAIADAAKNVANLVGLIPAVGFGAGVGVAGIATGLSGIPAAFKALKSEAAGSASSLADQRQKLVAVRHAEEDAASTTRALNTAYRDASRSIRDMNLDLDEQKLSVEDASISVDEAGKRLAEVQFDPTSDSTARRRAQNTYDEALARLRRQQIAMQDLQQDTAEANAAGVSGSDQVAAAQRAQARAADALLTAQENLAQTPGGGGGADKFAEAMADLSPNARELVTDIRSLGGAWTEARKASQDALTNGMGPAIKDLAEAQLPNLREGLVGVNTAINSGLRASIASLASDANKADFKKSLDNTALGFANAAKGAGPLTDALTKLVTVGSEFLPQFGTAIDNAANRFDNLIQRTAADGSLKKWLEDGITSTKTLGSIAHNTGSSFLSLLRAAGDNGQTLRSLDEMTERMARFLKSTEGQAELKAFFNEAREKMDALKPILSQLPEILGGVYNGFQAWANITLPFLRVAADLMAAHPQLVRDVVIAYLAVKTIGPIFDGVRLAIGNANTAVGNFRQGLSGSTGATGAVGALGAALGPAGVLGVAALSVGAGLGLSYLAKQHAEAEEAARKQQSRLEALGDTLDKTSGLTTQATITKAAEDLGKGGFLERARTLGVDGRQLTLAALGLAPDAKSQINERLTRIILEQVPKDASGAMQFEQTRQTLGLSKEDVAQALQGIPEAVARFDQAWAKKGNGSIKDLAELKAALNDIGESAATLGGEMNNTGSKIAELGKQTVAIDQASNGMHELTEQGKKVFDGVGVSVDKVSASTVVLNSATDEQIAKLKEMGYQAERLPGNKTVVVTLDNAKAKADIKEMADTPLNVKVNFEIGKFSGAQASGTVTAAIPANAIGGRLPTTGPGTDRRDGFLGVAAASGAPLAWLDGGEWIINRDSSARYHKELAAINAGTFPRHEEGGIIGRIKALDEYAQKRNGTPYGGINDCSGLISQLANVAAGLPALNGRMSTANEGEWLGALGWSSGKGGAGAFRVGWINDPSMPAGGHTAGTLPNGVNVESNGSQGVLYGGSAAGAFHPMFNQWSFLQMQVASTSPTVPGVGGTGTADTSGVTTQSVLSPQAALPGRRSDTELQRLQGEAAVDAANSERNRVYADPNSTEQDRIAADLKYQQAQNSLESSQKKKDESTPPNLQGIFSKAGSILATGLLSMFGLENSVLSETNTYNRAATTALNFYQQQNGQLDQQGYAYTPKNLPSMVTTVTPQSSAPVNDPALANAAPAPAAETSASTGNSVVDAVKNAMSPVGWNTGPQWSALDELVSHESSWNPTAQNPSSTAYGLFQFLDQTWGTVGGSKTSDPYLQAVYGQRYISQRYGDPSKAWSFWQAQNPHWYDQGGVASGRGFLAKQTLKPERVLSPRETETFHSALPLLESINASAWGPRRIDPSGFQAAPATAQVSAGGFSPTINARVADVSDLAELVERQAHKRAIGLMAALP
ncbi:transglycosylase SLT domain-containing protein [Nocardia arizonensis]|uniref:aggregation-promoting factor C-terminal-like domain-containing protein n=1 Tax=Nocardia arizonensis TaxID=1141647 RepID=UPI0006D2200B|nr:transglycosylase SLT domain-containing protein [Nocardia arizonensis]